MGCGDHKYDPEQYVVSPGALDQILTIVADRRAIPADGFSRTLIRAQISANADVSLRSVKFTTTAGTLVGATSGKDIDVLADAAGLAVIQLESDKALRTAVVRAKVGDVIRETTVEFTTVVPSDVVSLSSSPTIVPADGRSATRVVATVAPALPADRKRVQFITTLGTFAESEQKTFNPPSTINDQAGADLRSAEAGMARITANVDGVGAEVQVQFIVANPEQIVVSAQRALIPASGSQVLITARLLREIGIPTEGRIVTFTALTPTGLTVGHFSAIERSNAGGTATALFSAEGVTYRGPVRITATVQGVSGSVEVAIVDP